MRRCRRRRGGCARRATVTARVRSNRAGTSGLSVWLGTGEGRYYVDPAVSVAIAPLSAPRQCRWCAGRRCPRRASRPSTWTRSSAAEQDPGRDPGARAASGSCRTSSSACTARSSRTDFMQAAPDQGLLPPVCPSARVAARALTHLDAHGTRWQQVRHPQHHGAARVLCARAPVADPRTPMRRWRPGRRQAPPACSAPGGGAATAASAPAAYGGGTARLCRGRQAASRRRRWRCMGSTFACVASPPPPAARHVAQGRVTLAGTPPPPAPPRGQRGQSKGQGRDRCRGGEGGRLASAAQHERPHRRHGCTRAMAAATERAPDDDDVAAPRVAGLAFAGWVACAGVARAVAAASGRAAWQPSPLDVRRDTGQLSYWILSPCTRRPWLRLLARAGWLADGRSPAPAAVEGPR